MTTRIGLRNNEIDYVHRNNPDMVIIYEGFNLTPSAQVKGDVGDVRDFIENIDPQREAPTQGTPPWLKR